MCVMVDFLKIMLSATGEQHKRLKTNKGGNNIDEQLKILFGNNVPENLHVLPENDTITMICNHFGFRSKVELKTEMPDKLVALVYDQEWTKNLNKLCQKLSKNNLDLLKEILYILNDFAAGIPEATLNDAYNTILEAYSEMLEELGFKKKKRWILMFRCRRTLPEAVVTKFDRTENKNIAMIYYLGPERYLKFLFFEEKNNDSLI